MGTSLLRDAAAAAALAPSTHNTQPWRMRIHDGALELCFDDARWLSIIDPLRRQMIVSCGCALYNARIALRAAGFLDDTRLLPDPTRPELLAITRPGLPRAATDDDHALAAAIHRRGTYRRTFLDRPVAAEIAETLSRASRAERTQMFRLLPAQKLRLAELVADADRRRFDDPRYRRELGRWLAPVLSWRRDGIPARQVPLIAGRRLRSPELGQRSGAADATRIREAPVIAVFATAADEPIDWLDCGQALEAVLLRATTLGLAASYLNQVLEIQDLAEAVDLLFTPALNTQMILRLGYASTAGATAPRRPLDDVLAG